MRNLIVLVSLLIFGSLFGLEASEIKSDSLVPLVRYSSISNDLELSNKDKEWLKDKKNLRVGFSEPNNPPFDFSTNNREIEGLSVDYAVIVAERLSLEIETYRYKNRAEVLAALKSGFIDLVATSNSYEAEDPDLLLTDTYAHDIPVMVIRSDRKYAQLNSLDNLSVAMLYHYLPAHAVTDAYPHADLKLYPSAITAIAAVSLGQVDVFLGDSISASNLIRNNYFKNIEIFKPLPLKVNSYSYAAKKENRKLVDLVGAAIKSITTNDKNRIDQKWTKTLLPPEELLFTEGELIWMKRHPVVKVGFDKKNQPVTFYSSEGMFSGITADLLFQIGVRTGLQFESEGFDTKSELVSNLESQKVDLVSDFPMGGNLRSSGDMLTTRPYLSSPYVVVEKRLGLVQPKFDENFNGKVALIEDFEVVKNIRNYFPNVDIMLVDSDVDAVKLVESGEVDGAVTTLLNARYLITAGRINSLKISKVLPGNAGQFAFTMLSASKDLNAIMNKALLNIPPTEMEHLLDRWRGEIVIEDSRWRFYKKQFWQVLVGGLVLVVIFIIWITLLRKNIREREKAQRSLNDQLSFMDILVNGTPHPIYVRDTDTKLIACNSHYLHEVGLTRAQALKRTISETFSPGFNTDEYLNDFNEVLIRGLPCIKDRTIMLSEYRMVHSWLLPYRSGDGYIDGVIGGWIDISERQSLFEKLIETQKKAEEANLAKSNFVATLSHELRGPINAVIGMLELASLKMNDESSVVYIEAASFAATQMLDLIGDTLDLSVIESGEIILQNKTVNLLELISSITNLYYELARKKGLYFNVHFNDTLLQLVSIDPSRFKQVITNIMSNAIKFTSLGGINVFIDVTDSSQIPGMINLVIIVEDTGIGISIQDQKKLFKPFSKSGRSIEGQYIGTGLGLHISKLICDAMNASLDLRSIEGQGTSVRLELVVLKVSDEFDVRPVTKKTIEAELAKVELKVMVVEDYPPNRFLLYKQLSLMGHYVEAYESAIDALDAFDQNNFHLIITDCNMPIMSGYELSVAIRSKEAEADLMPVIILGLTANAVPEERLKCISSGMNDCAYKPINISQLDRKIQMLVGEVRGTETVTSMKGRYFKSALEVTGGDTSVAYELLRILIRTLQSELELIQSDRILNSELYEMTHRLKGAASIMGFSKLISICNQMTDLGNTGEEKKLTVLFSKLQQELHFLIYVLNQIIAT